MKVKARIFQIIKWEEKENFIKMDEEQKTILYGLKLERDLLRDEIKKVEKKYVEIYQE